MSTLLPPRLEGSLHLRTGRTLGYAEFGSTRGRPVLWFHGSPGAGRQISPAARQLARERDFRIIAVERPGIGSSTPHRYRSLSDFAADIEELCDALEVTRFGVAGLSGGGPYALACAHRMPRRVVATALLGGVAPAVGPDAIDGGPSALARWLSPVFARTHGVLGPGLRVLVRALEPWKHEAVDAFAYFMPPGDKRVFEDEAVREMFQNDLYHGARSFMQAILLDAVLFGRDWGFQLNEIEGPVHLWYGDADNIVPLVHGEHIAARLPNATLRIRPEEGHLGSLGPEVSHEIFDVILSHWPEAEAKTGASDSSAA